MKRESKTNKKKKKGMKSENDTGADFCVGAGTHGSHRRSSAIAVLLLLPLVQVSQLQYYYYNYNYYYYCCYCFCC